MTIQRLVHMANQVADSFCSYGEAEAIRSTADHLTSFWENKARVGLSHIALDAAKAIATRDTAAATPA